MILKAWFIEEIDLGNGNKGQRQSVAEFDSETGEWIRPDERLETEDAKTLWDTIMAQASNVAGEDIRCCVNPIGLMDYCNDDALGRPHRRLGKGIAE
jgi:hypothetical protein